MSKRLLWLGIGISSLALLVAAGLAFLYSGLYPIAADRPHFLFVSWALTTTQEHSVARYSADIDPPDLLDPTLVRRGLPIYRRECVICHGAPGIERPQIGRGLNPNPPRLSAEVVEWDDSELFWIVKHGLKMAGMPTFGTTYTDPEIWAVVALLRRLPELTVADYDRMVGAIEGTIDPATVAWLGGEDLGYSELLRYGDPDRGRPLVSEFGCGSCHVVPGVPGARGQSGPPLTRWAERHYIAGTRLNTPHELVEWIRNPQSVEPGTAMPALGVNTRQARDIAYYLYTLGAMPDALRNLAARGE